MVYSKKGRKEERKEATWTTLHDANIPFYVIASDPLTAVDTFTVGGPEITDWARLANNWRPATLPVGFNSCLEIIPLAEDSIFPGFLS